MGKEVKILVNDSFVKVIGDDPYVLQSIYASQVYEDNSLCYSRGRFDASKMMHIPLLKSFPDDLKLVGRSGLCDEIVEFCKTNNISISSFDDRRTHFDFQEAKYTHDQLRKFYPKEFEYTEHQIRALQEMLKHNSGLIVACTSAGKSKIISAYIRLIKLPTLILENKITLAMQLRDDLVKDGVDCGVVSGNGVKIGDCVVSTIQSIHKLLPEDLLKFKCLIIDEVQNASARTFQQFLSSFKVPLRFGFSASPERKGNKLSYAKIRQFMGSPIITVGSEELIENHVMAKPFIYLIKSKCEQTVDYPTAYSNFIVNNEIRNNQVVRIAKHYSGSVLILVNIIEHGEILKKKIEGSEFISGSTSVEERRQKIEDFENKKFPVLIASTILQEGISITHIDAMILACGGKSNVAIVQKIGRSLRYKKGEKTQVDFYDFIDNGNTFLYKHSRERVAIYRKEGYTDIKVVENISEYFNEQKLLFPEF